MGLFIDVAVWVFIMLVLVFVATQVIFPLFSGEPLFPFFRKSAVKTEIVKAESTLESVAEAAHLKKLADEIERQTAKLKDPK